MNAHAATSTSAARIVAAGGVGGTMSADPTRQSMPSTGSTHASVSRIET